MFRSYHFVAKNNPLQRFHLVLLLQSADKILYTEVLFISMCRLSLATMI